MPTVFMSYPRASDRGGKISGLREAIEEEIRLLTGDEEFSIFQDVQLGLGESWQRRLATELQQASFLLPIVQPMFFTNEACRAELTAFLERERALGRDDLILPIYYIDCEDFGPQAEDPLVRAVAGRRYADCRDIRHASEEKQRAAAVSIARRMVDAFRRVSRPARPAAPVAGPVAGATGAAPVAEAAPSGGSQPAPEQLDALMRLLSSMFSIEEFSRFLRFDSETNAIVSLLPVGAVSPQQLFSQAVIALAQHALIDARFFERLIGERPKRAGEIRRLQGMLLAGAETTGDAEPRRSFG
ncbi:TIR domain-containing protein [Nannocystis sp. SCPEA4]|uniref:TIR domain-containing protein n=1 Tax=Nannocystis sp. SCPEA4 TaxID=2996787 RepID=UPI00226E5C5C|nr:TIR domain-containing protein [Nannocystis sp. SCPEA4]MCY1059394.1 TIR domain-containing protein [Nannocystis sp. SCPEA4]